MLEQKWLENHEIYYIGAAELPLKFPHCVPLLGWRYLYPPPPRIDVNYEWSQRHNCPVQDSECVGIDHEPVCECKDGFKGNGSESCVPEGFTEEENGKETEPFYYVRQLWIVIISSKVRHVISVMKA